MKKLFALALALVLTVCVLAGCTGMNASDGDVGNATTDEQAPDNTIPSPPTTQQTTPSNTDPTFPDMDGSTEPDDATQDTDATGTTGNASTGPTTAGRGRARGIGHR